MRLPDELARTAIRFGLGRFTTAEEVDYVIGRVAETVAALRSLEVMSGPV
jgi:cysteine desulfurase